MADTPQAAIADHGLIGDLRTAALVDTAGTVDWLCLPRFDGASVFGALLEPGAGAWTIAPTCELTGTNQFYFPDTNILVTRFLTDEGVVEVQDFMPVVDGEEGRCLVRRVACVRGAMTCSPGPTRRSRCRPRSRSTPARIRPRRSSRSAPARPRRSCSPSGTRRWRRTPTASRRRLRSGAAGWSRAGTAAAGARWCSARP